MPAFLDRRGFLAGGAAAAAIGVAGCGSSGSTDPAAATRVVSTAKGRVRVPANPKRVVAINPIPMSTLYDLGINVVGIYDEGAEYVSPRYRARYQKAASVGDAGEVNAAKVAALNPDLVVVARLPRPAGFAESRD